MSKVLQCLQNKMQTFLHDHQSLLSKCPTHPSNILPLFLVGTLQSGPVDFKLYIFWNPSVHGNAIESMSGINSGEGSAEQVSPCP